MQKIQNLLNDDDDTISIVNTILPFNGNEALVLIEYVKLSKSQYDTIRKQSAAKNADLFIPQKNLVTTKNKCYSLPSSITVIEKGAQSKLQELLNHTCYRNSQILDILSFLEISNTNKHFLVMTSKWGCGGTSVQSTYK